MVIASPARQLAQTISTANQSRLIQRLSRNLTLNLARCITNREHARRVVFSCYVSAVKANRVNVQNTSYHLETARDTTYTYEDHFSILTNACACWHAMTIRSVGSVDQTIQIFSWVSREFIRFSLFRQDLALPPSFVLIYHIQDIAN